MCIEFPPKSLETKEFLHYEPIYPPIKKAAPCNTSTSPAGRGGQWDKRSWLLPGSGQRAIGQQGCLRGAALIRCHKYKRMTKYSSKSETRGARSGTWSGWGWTWFDSPRSPLADCATLAHPSVVSSTHTVIHPSIRGRWWSISSLRLVCGFRSRELGDCLRGFGVGFGADGLIGAPSCEVQFGSISESGVVAPGPTLLDSNPGTCLL